MLCIYKIDEMFSFLRIHKYGFVFMNRKSTAEKLRENIYESNRMLALVSTSGIYVLKVINSVSYVIRIINQKFEAYRMGKSPTIIFQKLLAI